MAISVVQALVVSNATSGTLSTATTAGNCLVYAVATEASSNVTMTVTGATLGGSAGNFAQAVSKQSGFASGAAQLVAIWTDPNCAGGQTAVAVAGTNLNIGAGTSNGFIVLEIAGVGAGSPVDVSGSGSGTTGTALSSGTTGTTSQAAEIAIGVVSGYGSLSAFTSGYTVSSVTGGPYNSCGYKVLSAAGSQSFGASQSASGPWAAAVITLKGASTTVSGSASLAGSGSLGGAWGFGGSASLAGQGTLASAWELAGSAALDGSGDLSGSGMVLGDNATLTGSGTLAATATETWQQYASLAGAGSLGALVTGTWQQFASLSGTGSLGLAVKLGLTIGLSGQGSLSIPQVSGGLVNGVGGAATPQALPGASQVAVAPPGSSNWQWLGTLGQVTALTYSFVCPGGCDKLTMTIMCPAAYRTQLFNPGWQVRVTRGGHQVWYGKLDEPQPSAQGWTLTAVGAGNLGANFTAFYAPGDVWPAGEPDEIINRAIGRGLPWTNPGLNSSPYFSQFWMGQATDPGSQTVSAFLGLICTRGGLTWYVSSQPGGSYGANNLSVFPLPTTPNRLLVLTTPVARTLNGDINSIVIRYMSVADNSTATPPVAASYNVVNAINAASVAAHGVTETYIDLSDVGQMSASQAQAVGNSVLEIYQRASFAGPFQVSYGQLLNMGGAAIDPGADQAGTMLRLILCDYGLGGEVVPGPIDVICGSYSWDDFQQVATITPFTTFDSSLTGILSAWNTVSTPITTASA